MAAGAKGYALHCVGGIGLESVVRLFESGEVDEVGWLCALSGAWVVEGHSTNPLLRLNVFLNFQRPRINQKSGGHLL